MKPRPELLGFHGLVFRAKDAARLARRFRDLLGLPVLRQGRDGIVLGSGPELFVRIRQTRDREEEGLEEIHAAMKDISATRKKARADPLGGDSWTRAAGRARVTARQFRRAPGPAWRKKRKPVN